MTHFTVILLDCSSLELNPQYLWVGLRMEKHKWQSCFLREDVLKESYILSANDICILLLLFLVKLQGGGGETEA